MPPRLGNFQQLSKICTRCALRQNRTIKRNYHAKVPNRTFISLEGVDALPFLQGLVTANLTKSAPEVRYNGGLALSKAIYTAFLNAHGRILHDVLISPGFSLTKEDGKPSDESFLIEVDSNAAKSLFKHLKKHKLRSKFKMRLFEPEELDVYSHWAGPGEAASDASKEFGFNQNESVLCAEDPRPGLLNRIVFRSGGITSKILTSHPHIKEPRDYTLYRMLNGLAEGQNEILTESSLPQESNIDFCNGIDFRKGCYLGQELTIRTHHTGVVRKRILPVIFSDIPTVDHSGDDTTSGPSNTDTSLIPGTPAWWSRYSSFSLPLPGSDISKLNLSPSHSGKGPSKGRSAGKFLAGIGNVGLALCRLEMLTDIRLTDTVTPFDPEQRWKISWEAQDGGGKIGQLEVKAQVPEWMRVRLERPHEEEKVAEDEEDDEYEDEEETEEEEEVRRNEQHG
ncbi:putative aminomethyl transferase [Phaeomoniella chlamydospora]|uniref:Iron-sulfur cluster assembly factor IBA57 homolog, mitochondrial n=1 Tax=Phaeomoniella chlamydospora TaxID=158046 RepID=A0A0G2E7B5_PHACM|nr:putative aminomethyl transferase [Phaeomoniella chlamydospora]